MPSLVEPATWTLPTQEGSSGCFETMRAYQGRIFRLAAHLERLCASAQYLGIRVSLRPSQLSERITAALARAKLPEAVVRVALIPDEQQLAAPQLVVQPVVPIPDSSYGQGISLAIVPTKKFPVGAIDPQTKYSARLGSILAVIDAQLRGSDEALFLDQMGGVTESTASNVWIVAHGTLITPPCWLGLLAGITRHVVCELAGSLGVLVRHVPLTRHEVYTADEAFLSSTIKEILPVTRVDGRLIGTGKPGQLTVRLHRAFRELVRRECPPPTGSGSRAASHRGGRRRRQGKGLDGRR